VTTVFKNGAKKIIEKSKNENGKKDTRWRQEIVASVTRLQKRVKNRKKGHLLETRNSGICDEAKNEK
jgi:hypothetical protein